ncbi:MAG: malonyl-CoA decarboxylase [Halieaceae bacterium]|nr:malonyl-CoA decarboxylase [Halieaceae bacterium]
MQTKPRTPRSVLNRTLDNLASGWKRISQLGNTRVLKLRPNLPDSDLKKLKLQMQDCLESKGGEVSSRARAAGLGQAYLELNDEGRYRFFKLLAKEFGIDRGALESTARAYLENTDDPEIPETMRAVLRPPWIKLFTQFNALPSGIKFLVDMRADMLRLSKQRTGLEALNNDLKNLLISWFDIGFLDLKRITWNEPAALLEKVIEYEAVHEILSWEDLKNRLDRDRCCYAFFHPRMPNEPLIFVQVALVNGLSTNVGKLLDNSAPSEDPENADTAIFYSISNTQFGLRGVSLGDFLIKRVVADLIKTFPNLKTFSTLSPVPGFRDFLAQVLDKGYSDMLDDSEKLTLRQLLGGDSSDWLKDEEISRAAKPLLMRLCVHYLLNEKRGTGARDSVANFHLTNGARIEQINWLGDLSEQGMQRSLGLMVNYLYKLSDIEKNHEAYVGQGEILCSTPVKSLLKKTQ